MQASCENCGARYALPDQQVGASPRVKFRCTKCGHTTIVDVAKQRAAAEQTQVVSAMPSFAQAGRTYSDDGTTMDPSLVLPADRSITISLVDGPAKGLIYPVTKPRVVLGRAGADVETNDPEVSRWHCALEIKDKVVRLRDLDSTNGIFMGDDRVRAAELSDGAEFRIGSTRVLVRIIPK